MNKSVAFLVVRLRLKGALTARTPTRHSRLQCSMSSLIMDLSNTATYEHHSTFRGACTRPERLVRDIGCLDESNGTFKHVFLDSVCRLPAGIFADHTRMTGMHLPIMYQSMSFALKTSSCNPDVRISFEVKLFLSGLGGSVGGRGLDLKRSCSNQESHRIHELAHHAISLSRMIRISRECS